MIKPEKLCAAPFICVGYIAPEFCNFTAKLFLQPLMTTAPSVPIPPDFFNSEVPDYLRKFSFEN